MNSEEENARIMPPKQDTAGPGEAAMPVPDPEGSARPGVTDVQAYIGRQLRAVYDDVVKQPIPDRFLDLMRQLEEGTGKG